MQQRVDFEDIATTTTEATTTSTYLATTTTKDYYNGAWTTSYSDVTAGFRIFGTTEEPITEKVTTQEVTTEEETTIKGRSL